MQQEMAPSASSSMPMMMEMSPPPQLRSSISDILSSKPYSSAFFLSGSAPPPLTSALINQTRTASATNTATAAVASLSRLMSQHQDLMSRYSVVMSQLQKTFQEAETLRQENTNLRVANCELSRQVTILVHAAALQSHLQESGDCSWSNEKKKETGGGSEEEFVEPESPKSVMENQMQKDKAAVDTGRETLPKSISVRSNGFLKISPGSGGSGGSAGSSGSSSEPKLKLGLGGSSRIRADSPVSGPQKVYVRGGGQKDGPIELEVYNQGMVKTELCNKWQETGECPYGDHCQFAHGIKELRPVIRHPRYKTEVCRMILSGVPCPYGHRCHFRHALTEQEKHMLPFRID